MRRTVVATLLIVGACHGSRDKAPGNANTGARLESAAIAAGLVVDPASRSLVGIWSRDTDRACVVPGEGNDSRIGVLIDYGNGGGCAASGTVRRHGAALDVRLGDCRVTARFDGERILFPPEVPAACDALCTGRASISAMSVDRQSESAAEAASLRMPEGGALCGSD